MSAVPQIPITHSILRADALAAVIAQAYDLGSAVHCELMARGVNDIYLVRAADTRYAARVLRHNFRTKNQVRYEMDLIRFYAGRGIAVSAPQPTHDDETFVPVQALEGERYLSLFAWAPGGPMAHGCTPAHAHRLGATVAKMHLAAGEFAAPATVMADTIPAFQNKAPALMAMVGGDSTAGRLYTDLLRKTVDRLQALDLPQGACHGDIHTHNVFRDEGGTLTFIDWDNCGADFFAKELMHFVWRNDYLGIDPALNHAFLAGYETVRTLHDDERAQLPFFLTVRHLFILCGMAGMINVVGRSAIGYQHQLSRFYDLIQKPARDAGLI